MDTIWNHEKIVAARKEAGLDAKNAAKLLGITPEYLSMIENSRAEPSLKLGRKMTTIYQQPLAHFLIPEKIFILA
jgi:DNA-binding XRE family transcriptional regulator